MEELKVPEKTSRWSDAEREAAATPPEVPPTTDARPPLPPWVVDFAPGSTFTANGWEIGVCHVGHEEGMWAMLVMPIRPTKGASRSEFRRLRAQVGKKEAKRLVAKARPKKANGEQDCLAILEPEDAES